MGASLAFGMVATLRPDETRVAATDLAEWLAGRLEADVTAQVVPTYDALVSEMERDRVQVAWMSPALLVLAEERLSLRPLVSTVRGDKTGYRAVLFVASSSRWQSLEDLKGEPVAWVDASSAAGYLYPRLHLAARGIDPAGHFGQELFLGSHHEVVRAVLDGRAQVGATFAERPPFGLPLSRAGFLEVPGGEAVRVLEWTGLIPNDVVAAHGLLHMRQQTEIAHALLDLGATPFGADLARRLFQADRFVLASRRALRPLRQLVRVARQHGLLATL